MTGVKVEATATQSSVSGDRPSANGYLLECDGYTLHATWPAAYFVLHRSFGFDGPDEPLLQHCETLADAKWRSTSGGVILDALFNETDGPPCL